MMEQVIHKLSDRDHVLLRPAMYVGSTMYVDSNELILNADGKFERRNISTVPAIIKIVNEVLDNSVDEAVRTNFQFATKIKLTATSTSVCIEDNGRGIPIKKAHGHDAYMPVLAFTEAKAGSNFGKDEERLTIGMNGFGAYLTNVFSKTFKAETADGSNKLTLDCADNLSKHEFSIRKSDQRFTRVYFEPDFSRFEVKSLDYDHQLMIKQRLCFLSLTYPQITFFLNGKKISFDSSKQFLSLFHSNLEFIESEGWLVAVFPSESDDFSQLTYVNGLHVKGGGNHVDLIMGEVSSRLRDKYTKKFPSLKPGDIKNKLSTFILFNNFPNAKWDSQTKEKFVNSSAEIKTFLKWETANELIDKLVYKLFKNEAISGPIVDLHRLKEELKNRQLAQSIAKPKKIKNDKYFPPIGEQKILMLTEGDSAFSGLQKVLGRKNIGYFALRGKPLNSFEIPLSKVLANNELKSIIEILGADVSKGTYSSYEYVCLGTDQDLDGYHIRVLLAGFFKRFISSLVSGKKLTMLQTPIVVIFEKGIPKKWFYELDDYRDYTAKNKLTSSESIVYYKGLGSWQEAHLKYIIEKEGGIDKLMIPLEETEFTEENLSNWLSGDRANKRKESLADTEFDLFSL
jgi:DNA gyrase/topoisomerase IV subunit B